MMHEKFWNVGNQSSSSNCQGQGKVQYIVAQTCLYSFFACKVPLAVLSNEELCNMYVAIFNLQWVLMVFQTTNYKKLLITNFEGH
jgi:hypothetical protein